MPVTTPFDPADPSFLAGDRWPGYAALRDESPILTLPFPGPRTHVVSRFDDVAAILKDAGSRVRPPAGGVPPWLPEDGAAAELFRGQMVLSDPPDHNRLRKLVSQGFLPHVIGGLRPAIEASVDAILDDLEQRDSADAVTGFAELVPRRAICSVLGLPEADWGDLVARAADFVLIFSPVPLGPDEVARLEAACAFYDDYFGAVIEERRGRGGEDVVARLIAAEEDGDRLDRRELVATLHSFLNAGFETTMTALTTGLRAVAGDADSRAALRHEPGLVPAAVSEVLRWEAPVHFTWRYAGTPVERDGVRIEVGEQALLCLAAANRDERHWEHPDRFDARRDARQHLAYGGGRHVCIGRHLGQLELEIALGKWLERFPDFELSTDRLERQPNLVFPSPVSLPVTLR